MSERMSTKKLFLVLAGTIFGLFLLVFAFGKITPHIIRLIRSNYELAEAFNILKYPLEYFLFIAGVIVFVNKLTYPTKKLKELLNPSWLLLVLGCGIGISLISFCVTRLILFIGYSNLSTEINSLVANSISCILNIITIIIATLICYRKAMCQKTKYRTLIKNSFSGKQVLWFVIIAIFIITLGSIMQVNAFYIVQQNISNVNNSLIDYFKLFSINDSVIYIGRILNLLLIPTAVFYLYKNNDFYEKIEDDILFSDIIENKA